MKTEHKKEDGDRLRNRSKIPNEVKPGENKSKNSQSFLEKSRVQKLHINCKTRNKSNRILSNKKKMNPTKEISKTNPVFQVCFI